MIYKFKQGHHWPDIISRLLSYGIFWGRFMEKRIMFDPSCKYDLPGDYDDEDVNKLFGFSFTIDHHKESARVGWYYNSELNKFILVAYCYVEGKRRIEFLGEFNLFEFVSVRITPNDSHYLFSVRDNNGILRASVKVSKWKRHEIGYTLGAYFGGNKPAPHDMKITLKNV
jgi:hypothetical protein